MERNTGWEGEFEERRSRKYRRKYPEKRDPVGRRWVVRRSEYLGEEISQVSCRCSGKEKSVGGKKIYYSKIVFQEKGMKVKTIESKGGHSVANLKLV